MKPDFPNAPDPAERGCVADQPQHIETAGLRLVCDTAALPSERFDAVALGNESPYHPFRVLRGSIRGPS